MCCVKVHWCNVLYQPNSNMLEVSIKAIRSIHGMFKVGNGKVDGSVVEEKSSLRCWSWLSLLNWIGALTLSLVLELPLRKLEPWFILWSFFLLRLLCISINLQYGHTWNTVVKSGLVLLVATLVDVHLNWLNWFHFRILKGSLLIILIECIVFLSSFRDVTRMSMSAISFLTQLDSEILCP